MRMFDCLLFRLQEAVGSPRNKAYDAHEHRRSCIMHIAHRAGFREKETDVGSGYPVQHYTLQQSFYIFTIR